MFLYIFMVFLRTPDKNNKYRTKPQILQYCFVSGLRPLPSFNHFVNWRPTTLVEKNSRDFVLVTNGFVSIMDFCFFGYHGGRTAPRHISVIEMCVLTMNMNATLATGTTAVNSTDSLQSAVVAYDVVMNRSPAK